MKLSETYLFKNNLLPSIHQPLLFYGKNLNLSFLPKFRKLKPLGLLSIQCHCKPYVKCIINKRIDLKLHLTEWSLSIIFSANVLLTSVRVFSAELLRLTYTMVLRVK